MDAEPAETTEVVRSGGRPAEQLAALLARAENPVPAALRLAAARPALMHHCALQSCRHTKGPPRRLDRRTFRHSFLLPDGQVRVLWELEHTTAPGPGTRYAVFGDREGIALAEWEVDAEFGGPSGVPELPPDAFVVSLPSGGTGWGQGFVTPGQEALRRAYTEGDSAEHARRLLRRAANSCGPDGDLRQRLRGAIAHEISIVTRRSTFVAGRQISWSLYEHAFLLLDGSEVSLWEIDHTRTPSGDPVCEVYASRDDALDTAVRRIEAA